MKKNPQKTKITLIKMTFCFWAVDLEFHLPADATATSALKFSPPPFTASVQYSLCLEESLFSQPERSKQERNLPSHLTNNKKTKLSPNGCKRRTRGSRTRSSTEQRALLATDDNEHTHTHTHAHTRAHVRRNKLHWKGICHHVTRRHSEASFQWI